MKHIAAATDKWLQDNGLAAGSAPEGVTVEDDPRSLDSSAPTPLETCSPAYRAQTWADVADHFGLTN